MRILLKFSVNTQVIYHKTDQRLKREEPHQTKNWSLNIYSDYVTNEFTSNNKNSSNTPIDINIWEHTQFHPKQ